ncbi:MAG: hypothetical protein ACE5KM_14880 [Planctomycetaceae bacterium]
MPYFMVQVRQKSEGDCGSTLNRKFHSPRSPYSPPRVSRSPDTQDPRKTDGWQAAGVSRLIALELCHYSPGTSQWNKIEHRLFCRITRNWQGVPLESHELVASLVGSTRTETGLEVHAWRDSKEYETSKKVNADELADVHIQRDDFHGAWNYKIIPQE